LAISACTTESGVTRGIHANAFALDLPRGALFGAYSPGAYLVRGAFYSDVASLTVQGCSAVIETAPWIHASVPTLDLASRTAENTGTVLAALARRTAKLEARVGHAFAAQCVAHKPLLAFHGQASVGLALARGLITGFLRTTRNFGARVLLTYTVHAPLIVSARNRRATLNALALAAPLILGARHRGTRIRLTRPKNRIAAFARLTTEYRTTIFFTNAVVRIANQPAGTGHAITWEGTLVILAHAYAHLTAIGFALGFA
jgi:hypothetical protein